MNPEDSSLQPAVAGWHRIDAWANGRVAIGAALVVLALLIVVRVMQPIGNPDTGWHIEMGRHFIATGSTASSEPFTHTAPGAHMVSHEWLGQIGLHGVDELGGLLAVRLSVALLAAGLFLAQFFVLRRLLGSPVLALLGAFLFIVMAVGRFQARPHVVNIGIAMGLHVWLFLGRPKLSNGQLVGLFAGLVVWANLHAGGALVFALLISSYAAAEWLQQRVHWREPAPGDLGEGRTPRLIALAGLCWLAVVCTPNHLMLFPHLIAAAEVNAGSVEWRPLIGLLGRPENPPLAYEGFLVLSLVTAVAIGLAVKNRRSLSQLAVVLVAVALPLLSLRFLWLCFIPIGFVLQHVEPWVCNRVGQPFAKLSGLVSAISLAAIVAIAWPSLFTFGGIQAGLARFDVASNLSPSRFPIGAAQLLGELDLEGKLYNPEHWGGYLLHASRGERTIFSDGRWVTVGLRVHEDNRHIYRHQPRAFPLLDEYGIDILLVERGWMRGDDPAERAWIAIYHGYNSSLFLRRQDRQNLERVADYYRAQKIAFDETAGFDEREALTSNPLLSPRFRIGPVHLSHFRPDGEYQAAPTSASLQAPPETRRRRERRGSRRK